MQKLRNCAIMNTETILNICNRLNVASDLKNIRMKSVLVIEIKHPLIRDTFSDIQSRAMYMKNSLKLSRVSPRYVVEDPLHL